MRLGREMTASFVIEVIQRGEGDSLGRWRPFSFRDSRLGEPWKRLFSHRDACQPSRAGSAKLGDE
jgi:hypothetical protein